MNRGSASASGEGAGAGRNASMRPRFMNRGSAARATGSCRSQTRFNEAPIHESGKLCWRLFDKLGVTRLQ